ncbi:unnamed protein product [Angiostrongylus costaricensis]|uniref:Uncharacterized protein n=1 Tax=Angiostrongylus costaricensis TaxID=334426 RepID=A0A0R3PNE6_ANGCS|nr:unnamed protein product [Angiostrongylus costaricensis]
MSEAPSAESVSSTSTADEAPRKLTKAEKKALYRPSYAEPHETRRKVLKAGSLCFISSESIRHSDLKHELITSILFSVYELDENPYMAMLQLHKICPDYLSNKAKSLAGEPFFFCTAFLSHLLCRSQHFSHSIRFLPAIIHQTFYMWLRWLLGVFLFVMNLIEYWLNRFSLES